MAETPKPQAQQQQVQIKADEKELLGQYSNLVVVHHNQEEFTLNFVYMFPTAPQGKLIASMIVNPRHAKRLMRALEENVSRYEAQFALPEDPSQCGSEGGFYSVVEETNPGNHFIKRSSRLPICRWAR
jgi:hypothetical protein